jgi:hypothetical protein
MTFRAVQDQKSLTDKQIRAASTKAALAVFEEPISALEALGIADRDARQAPELRSAAVDKAQQIRADAELRAQEIRDAAERKAQEAIAAADQKAREVEDHAEVEVDRRFEEWQSSVKHALSVGWSRKKLRDAGIDLTPPPKARKRRGPKASMSASAAGADEAGGSPPPQDDLPEAAIPTPAAAPDTVLPYSA